MSTQPPFLMTQGFAPSFERIARLRERTGKPHITRNRGRWEIYSDNPSLATQDLHIAFLAAKSC